MRYDKDVEELLETCLRGDRDAIRECVDACLERIEPDELLVEMILPSIERIETLGREDRLSSSAMNVVLRSMRLAAGRLIERPMADVGTMVPRSTSSSTRGRTSPRNSRARSWRRSSRPTATESVSRAVASRRTRSSPTSVGSIPTFSCSTHRPPGMPRRSVRSSTRFEASAPGPTCRSPSVVASSPAAGLAEEIGADLWSDEPALLRRVIVEEAINEPSPSNGPSAGGGDRPTCRLTNDTAIHGTNRPCPGLRPGFFRVARSTRLGSWTARRNEG